ncbi:MAG: cytochrome c3 family protein [Bacteroidales bacterium]|nr:cytochrome c3 family protein [Bacteroidales bacterium]MDG1902374.1 cytochrome c3 family protein [Bacteroidales bacterium]MDG2080232.1 cytochrome c3 family protein [Bacteroidales bacterium]
MTVNNFVRINPLIRKGYIFSGLFSLLMLISMSSFSQTAQDEKNYQQCKVCHNIDGAKLIGPNLKGISEKRDEAWLIKFIQNSQEMIKNGDELAVQVYNENNKIPMPSHDFTDEEVRGLLLYIEGGGVLPESEAVAQAAVDAEEQHADKHDVAEDAGLLIAQMKRDGLRNMSYVFIIMVILFIVSLFDLVVIHVVKAKWIHYIIMLVSVVVISEIVFVEATSLGRQQYYQPDQPVWFSHKIHAGQNQIDCRYCHFTVDRSMSAGIPTVETCLNCHNQVKEGSITGKKEIEKIYASIENNKPIEWVKVYNLPDHVYFNHAQHVNVGKLECAQCHGEVEKMDEIIQIPDLSMGWCIECHRTEDVQFATNKFYDQYKELHQKLKDGEISNVKVDNIGGDECAKCHY